VEDRDHPHRGHRLRHQLRLGHGDPISTATNKPGRAIRVGSGPGGIAITPDGATAYVANAGSGTVTPIRTATNLPGPAIKVGSGPEAVAITP